MNSQLLTDTNDHEFGEEFCPSCGNWAPLIEDTGWCLLCTRRLHPDLMICETCDSTFNGRGQVRHKCQRCANTDWQARNADRIESYMAKGYSYDLARLRVEHDNRPLCLACGKRIKGGTRGRHFFCRRSQSCRTAARRYKWLRERYHLSKAEAIATVLQSLVETGNGTHG